MLRILVVAGILNAIFGKFSPGFAGQPAAHTSHLWNLLGMSLVGLGSVLLGGCPLRQLISAGGGSADAVMTVFGMIAGAATAHNLGLAASPKGVPFGGKAAVVLGLVVCAIVGLSNREPTPNKAE